MKYAVVVLTPPNYTHHKGFYDVARPLNQALCNLGYDSVIRSAPDSKRQNIILGSNLIPYTPVEIPDDAILYNLEYVKEDGWFKPQMVEAHQKCEVWDFCQYNVALWKERGVTVKHILPMGYVELDHDNLKMQEEPEYDVMLVGGMEKYRKWVMEGVARQGLKVGWVFDKYGYERDKALMKAKVQINVQVMRPKILEIVRLVRLFRYGLPVVSERGCNFDEYEPIYNDCAVWASFDDMIHEIVQLVGDKERREYLGQKAKEVFKSQRLEPMLEAIIKEQ